jgi:large subunit ribosomal protein L3
MSEQNPLKGMLGEKMGMTHFYQDDGKCIPVTMVKVGPCIVLQQKTLDNDGYVAVQIGFGPQKQQRVGKALRGHFGKAAQGCFRHVQEMQVAEGKELPDVGSELKISELFQEGDFVDVTGVSLGRGFSGVVRRYGVKGQPATRGTHEVRRHIGSVGCRKTPGRIFKNKKMPGRHGGTKSTVQNLRVIKVLEEEGVLLVKGAVPGPRGNIVKVRRAAKKSR